MVSLGNGIPGNRSGAYFFEEDSDDQSGSDVSPLLRRSPSRTASSNQHIHLVTGYLSAFEVLVLVAYAGSLLGLTLWKDEYKTSSLSCNVQTDRLVAYFSMIHVVVWIVVGILDRVVQWRHQVIRRKGYLKFYRRMRNIRRLPFIAVSISNAVQLLFMSLLYYYNIGERQGLGVTHHGITPMEILYIIVGVELVITLPCLIYYIVQAAIFNCAKQPPDVIQETYSGPESPTTSVTAVGFRDGEDLDELLERQADMIRYLQQHNANLGRRILELQAQAME